ncbi:hypothetical protein ACU4GD_05560 [Cupriavidus basilensis]
MHRTTIYRRWPDQASLLIAELPAEHTACRNRCGQFTGDWRVSILPPWRLHWRDFLSDPVEIAMNTLIADRAVCPVMHC